MSSSVRVSEKDKDIKSRLVIKAVRNVRYGYHEEDDTGQGMYRKGIKLDLERARLITESYRATDGEAFVMRRARALEHILSNMTIYMNDWERVVGNHASRPESLTFWIDMNWRSVVRVVKSKDCADLLDDEGRVELEELAAYWKGKSMSDRHQSLFTGEVLRNWAFEGTIGWTQWSELGIPDYEKIFRVGLKGILEEAEQRLADIERDVPVDYLEQREFLDAVVISLKAAIDFAHRYVEKARAEAASASGEEDRKRLEEIAETCSWVPENPPRTLLEAFQSFFFVHLVRYIEYSTLGIGMRFDKIFGPYLERDLESGRLSDQEALELMQLLWVKLHELGLLYSPSLSMVYEGVEALQAITLGGVDEEGNDVTNKMTYLVLDAAESMRTLEPNIALRCHDGTPEELLSRATDVIRTGIGYPSLFNDQAILPLLEKWNVPLEDARDYAMSGCVYIEIPGKNIARRVIGGLFTPKCLWWALHEGRSRLSKQQFGAPTPDPRTFTNVDELLDAYAEQVRLFIYRLSSIENTSRSLYEKYLPRPFYSAILEGCIEKGKDTRRWAYPSSVHDFIVMLGITNVADSITAIKKVVLDDKRITMDDLIGAMDANWEGYEDVRQMMINAPKYGNDDDYADEIAARVHELTAQTLAEFTDRFGNPLRGDGSGLSATYTMAIGTPATPDGRKEGETFADATLSPIQGRDLNGPTAVLKSASRVKAVNTYNHLLNQKFSPSMLEGDKKQRFVDYLRTWGDLGVSHVQFNIVDRETLLAAQKKPQDYQSLVVRVAGYSAYFVDLSRGLQDAIIARSEQSF
jgi:formate C-acetyltransferase